MEFWGVEVKTGESIKVTPGDGMVLHLSQATLGELKKEKGKKSVCLYVNVEGNKFVLGTLFTRKLPQQQFDLIFDRDLELSHNFKSGSVYFYGYRASNPSDEDELQEGESDESESEEDIPLTASDNGKHVAKPERVKPAETGKAVNAKDKGSDSGKRKEVNEDSSEDDSDDSGAETDESDEETPPKKAELSKKRAADSSARTPLQEKKAKATPQKTDGKKPVEHVATPYPSEHMANTPRNKPYQVKPKYRYVCESCNKNCGLDHKCKEGTVYLYRYKIGNGGELQEGESDGKKPVEHVAKPYPSEQMAKIPWNMPYQVQDDSGAESDEEETPPKKVKGEPSKKRPSHSSQEKNAKPTPQKTDGKKPGGSHVCKSCNKKALESHSKPKHSRAK